MTTTGRTHRFEVWPREDVGDPKGEGVRRAAPTLGIRPTRIRTARVYLLRGPLSEAQAERIRRELLENPVLERSIAGASPTPRDARVIEVHPLPGVMDPAAQTVRDAVRELTSIDTEVVTGWRYEAEGITDAEAARLAKGLLANEVVEQIHDAAWWPEAFPAAAPADQTLRHIPIRDLDDAALERLSRDGHLFLSLDEMRAIRAHYRALGREPTDIELETLAQTWSEHCVHKTLKSTVRYRGPAHDTIDWRNRPGVEIHTDGAVTIHNLLKSTVAAATFELIADGLDWTLSVFKDNAGIIRFDASTAVCVKVETHNHPSAIEPYGGAATGIGGVIRDIIGTGLGARPIANTDVFCVAFPDGPASRALPKGCLHPRRVLTRIVEGVRDYGNRMGIPTVNGAVWFDDRYIGNPLVFCGSVGVIPESLSHGSARPGDRIVAIGGRTGRDGIHGATFSSAELTDTHADEFSHAVQIGNAIEEKRTLEAILRARDEADAPLYTAITDCGAGGFSSAVGEMGAELGAIVDLDAAPLKYAGLRYDEIWISESQERMVVAVPEANLARLRTICAEEGVEMAVLGTFGTPDAELILRFRGAEVGRLPMHFLHDGIPMPVREAVWEPKPAAPPPPPSPRRGEGPGEAGGRGDSSSDVRAHLLSLLAHPNIASKRWIIRQYDHEVQGATIIKPLVGPTGNGPSDAAVIQPVPTSRKGLAIACGLAIPEGDPLRAGSDPYRMALAAVDECIRNLVCVGANPDRIAILDNFCWPSCAKPQNMGSLVRAAIGCYDAAKAYRTPFVSGKDSLNNQFRTEDGTVIEIPPTLLITGIGTVSDISRCVTSDMKRADSELLVVRADADTWRDGPRIARLVAGAIARGWVRSAHDASEGGILVAIAEMLIGAAPSPSASSSTPSSSAPSPLPPPASPLGGEAGRLRPGEGFPTLGLAFDDRRLDAALSGLFTERPGVYILELDPARIRDAMAHFGPAALRLAELGCTLTTDATLRAPSFAIPIADLRAAFTGTLDW
jgi:phosphoribosylformylglycinamidine synthase